MADPGREISPRGAEATDHTLCPYDVLNYVSAPISYYYLRGDRNGEQQKAQEGSGEEQFF